MFFTRDRDFYKTLVRLAIPIALQNAVTFAVNFADNLMVGTLGDSAISGVYVGNQLQTVLQMFVAGIEGAILILAASTGESATPAASGKSRRSACGSRCWSAF